MAPVARTREDVAARSRTGVVEKVWEGISRVAPQSSGSSCGLRTLTNTRRLGLGFGLIGDCFDS